MRLHGLEIPVADLDRAFRFYADVLEFPPVTRSGDASATFFLGEVHGGNVTLVKKAEPPSGAGPVIVLATDEGIEAIRARLESRDVQFLGPTSESPLGVSAAFLDSEGNRLAIFDGSITARLRGQALAPLGELRDRLGELERLCASTVAGVSEPQARHHPAPGEWTIVDQLGHIVDSLDTCGMLATELSHGRHPARGRLYSKEYPADSLDAAVQRTRRAFADAHAWLDRLPAHPNREATFPHGVFGPLNGMEWVAFMLFHVRLHLNQAEAIKKSPAFPA